MTAPDLQLEMGDEFKPQPFVFEEHPRPGPAYRFSIPWQYCISDNERMAPIILPGKRGAKPQARMVLAGPYKKAKKRIQDHLTDIWNQPLIRQPCFLFGYVLAPSYQGIDAGNYRKLITDCFSLTVYADDSLVRDERWMMAGLSRGNPRIEIVLGVIPDKRLSL